MRRRLLLPLLRQHGQFIGQVRKIPCCYLASETHLTASEIVSLDSNRRQIEPIFHWKGFDPKSGKFQCSTPAFWADADDPPCKKAA
ncbi:hypothetical protein AFERRID_00600 [Acidithiobacillus ferridurans]|uniref:Uncharacterized protein n=2 Tax=Acidithiobacillus ferridurans TaxID=1232575 RepID=A0A2Z6IE70_ACIFI|nr:hypothetical protein [Acidithiobacillus ferridurans]BBF63842.1 hypothetical protein AFERRID_00600 [Acidithiobacillus ferridurans]